MVEIERVGIYIYANPSVSFKFKRGDIMWICIGFVIGVIIGSLCSWIFIERRFNNGTFEVNESDASKDVYKMMVDDFDKLHKRKWLLLRITRK